MKRKVFSILALLCLAVSSAWAETIDLTTVTASKTAQDGDVLTGTLDGATQKYKISIADNATVTLDGVTINGVTDGAADASKSTVNWAGLTCEGNATIILKEGTTNTVRGFYHRCPGIFVPQGYTLTIDGTGTLNASGSISTEANHVDKIGNLITCAPGIGSAVLATAGNIVINGGTINATGGWASASIGGNFITGCGNITITGGTVNATGSLAAAGIGGGWVASCGDIAITGGTINATGGDYINSDATGNDGGPAIGGSPCGSCGTITIGGTANVTVTKGLGVPYSIGQGGSWNNVSASCGTVTVFGVEGQISNSPYTCISLSEESDNSKTLTMYDGQTADVNLTRTLQTGGWNTFAAPFSMAIPAGWTVKELESATLESSTLTLNFRNAASLVAGNPYLVKVTADADLSAAAYTGVIVSSAAVPTTTEVVDFIPTLGKTTIKNDVKSILFLGAANKLHHPSAENQDIKGFRAYFQLKGDGANVKSFMLNLGDGETTGIQTIDNGRFLDEPSGKAERTMDNSVFDLQGRRINKAAQKGVYIVNGKKTIIK
ncbi:MAG: hypothetical protein IK144_06605 [Bacteroidaceae bacterium]|nr:hypothetical protein [Bacteroidaceae bacterium]